jgi:uncharacterized membrane protein YqhA
MFWKRKTDEEFVESQRKWLLRSRWVAFGALVAAICTAVIYMNLFVRLLEVLIDKDKVGVEFAKGIVVGIVIAKMMLAVGGLVGVAMVWLWKPRVLRLLVAYHDRLQALEKPSASAGTLLNAD